VPSGSLVGEGLETKKGGRDRGKGGGVLDLQACGHHGRGGFDSTTRGKAVGWDHPKAPKTSLLEGEGRQTSRI